MTTRGADDGLYARLAVGAVLLAAGSGSRFGGKPKPLLELAGLPLIRHQLIALLGAGVNEVVVVLGHHALAIEAALRDFRVTIVHNPAPDDGHPSSLRIGLQGLSAKLDAVIVALADQPLINAQDISALIDAFRKRGNASIVVPRVAGLPGNPVIIAASLRDEWLAGDVNAAGRQWRDDHPERVHWFDSENQRYRIDIDTQEDLLRFAERTGQVLKWPAALAGSVA